MKSVETTSRASASMQQSAVNGRSAMTPLAVGKASIFELNEVEVLFCMKNQLGVHRDTEY